MILAVRFLKLGDIYFYVWLKLSIKKNKLLTSLPYQRLPHFFPLLCSKLLQRVVFTLICLSSFSLQPTPPWLLSSHTITSTLLPAKFTMTFTLLNPLVNSKSLTQLIIPLSRVFFLHLISRIPPSIALFCFVFLSC